METKQNQTKEEINNPQQKGYYLTETIENKWGVAYWDGIKFWDDPCQDGKLSFGIKRDWIIEWYELPPSLQSEIEKCRSQNAELNHEIYRIKSENEELKAKWEYERERRMQAECVISQCDSYAEPEDTPNWYAWQSIVSRESNVYKTDKTE